MIPTDQSYRTEHEAAVGMLHHSKAGSLGRNRSINPRSPTHFSAARTPQVTRRRPSPLSVADWIAMLTSCSPVDRFDEVKPVARPR